MKLFIKTLKWELVRWYHLFSALMIAPILFLIFAVIVPVPNDNWNPVLRFIVLYSLIGVGFAMLLGVFMLFVYPILLIAGSEIFKTTLLERGNGNDTANYQVVRVFISAVTGALGIAIWNVSRIVLQPFAENNYEWIPWLYGALEALPPFTMNLYIWCILWFPAMFITFITLLRLNAKKLWKKILIFAFLGVLGFFSGYWIGSGDADGWGIRIFVGMTLITLSRHFIDDNLGMEVASL